MSAPIPISTDGYYHPSSQAELVALVKWASRTAGQLRVRGSTHTFPHRAIFTDDAPGASPREVNVMLDRYRAVRWIDEKAGLVEVEAGCNLSFNPYDPTQTSTLENGLLYELQRKGGALSDLGGITHQTVSGFLSTGSSGGSLKYGIDENVVAIRFIDGDGEIHDVSRDTEPDVFAAVGVSMGLLGVLSKITFRCIPTFNIEGTEATTGEADCEVDLFGDGTRGRIQAALGKILAERPAARKEVGQVLRRSISALERLSRAPRNARSQEYFPHRILARALGARKRTRRALVRWDLSGNA